MNEIRYERYLEPRYDSRASFYKKAVVEIVETTEYSMHTLFSCGTRVAEYVSFYGGKKVYKWLGNWSQTTSRHQKEFFRQYGVRESDMKELKNDGILEYESWRSKDGQTI